MGTIIGDRVQQRAVELAFMNGRSAHETTTADWDQAKSELTGVNRTDPKEVAVEALADSGTWDPVPSSTGGRVPPAAGEDEDREGRSDQQGLVEEGLAGADRNHRLQAAVSASNDEAGR